MSTVRIQVRRGTAAQWASVNPVLAGGEMGVETDTNKFKFGNGADTWSSLPYAAADTPAIGEISQDAINQALSVGSGLTKSYDDAANTISVGIDDAVVATKTYVDGQISSLNTSLGNSLTDYVPVSDMGVANGVATLNSSGKVPSTQLDVTELAQDAVNTALVAGTGIAKSYDDNANTITLSVDATTAEISEDTNLYYTDARARGAISSSDGIDYSQSTGVIKINNSVATRTYVDQKIADVVNAAPAALDTLKEIATSLNDNADFAGTMTTQLSAKAPINNPTFTGTVTIPAGASIDGYLTAATAATTYETKSSATAYLKSTDAASTYETKADFRDDVRQALLVDASTTYLTKTVDGTTKEITLNVNDSVIATKAHAEGYADTAASQAQTAATNAAEGYTDTKIATEVSNRNTAISSGVSTHNSATTNVHGISDTSKLVATTDTGTVATAMIADSAVTTAKVNDGAITSAKIADGTIVAGDIADGAITSAKILDGTIVNADINATAAIAATKISGTAVTQADTGTVTNTMLAGSIAPAKITGTAITAADTGTVTSTMIADGTIVNGDINASAAIAATKIAGTAVTQADTGTVTSTMILDGTIVNGDINASAAIAQSKIANLTTDLAAKAALAGATFTGDVTVPNITVSGNLTVSGTTTTVSSTNLEVTDPLIYIATGNAANANDIGIVGHATVSGTYQHMGLVRDHADGKWKLFSGVTTEPANGTISLTGATYDTLKAGTFEGNLTGNVTGNADTVTNGVYLTTAQTLTNKTLTAPVISTISNTGTLTLPTSTDTLVGKATTDTFTNKTFDTAGTGNSLKINGTAVTAVTGSGSVVLATSPTLVTPTLGAATATSITFSDGTQSKQGVPSITPINQQTASYTTVLTDRDSLVEVNNASAVTVTIPPNSSVAYPVGTSIDILQTGAGQVTIAAGSGVTVNATPGLKLRTQWSSATLFKRATDTWVVFGDLSA